MLLNIFYLFSLMGINDSFVCWVSHGVATYKDYCYKVSNNIWKMSQEAERFIPHWAKNLLKVRKLYFSDFEQVFAL